MDKVKDWVAETKYFSTTIIDKDNIPMLVVLILLFLLIILVEKHRKILIVLGSIWSLLMLGILIKPVETAKLLPFIQEKIVMTRELGNDEQYSMYLSTDDAEDEIFTFSKHTVDELTLWLEDYQDKNIYLRVDKGQIVAYSKYFGKVLPNNAETFYGIYQYWVDNSIVPEEKSRYKLWKFYLDA